MSDERGDRPYLKRFLRGRRGGNIAPDDLAALEAAAQGEQTYRSRAIVVRAGSPVTNSTLLLEGFMCRYMDDRAGHRQLVAIHVPGDFVDLHGFPMGWLDHDIGTIGSVRVANWAHSALEEVLEHRPRLTRMMWFSTLLDAAMHREWVFRLGRLDAIGRVAHLLCELEVRLDMVGLAENGRYHLPLTQADLAEACGLTGVHVNRVLRSLRERELLLFRNNEVTILDKAALRALAEFDPMYLYGDPPDR
ncbi:Crp/Fnr family transcriptional regulator [Sphingomonas rubra]|uniref:cAMP-binding domain of CRP or a regulatory subunit of cAMP-dependent protein kinases n=1 Tax=Sphingomonas rubra TaxID=634430 RepID=A0A1I5RQS3_9SPHN|nr:Crp/Fnr family transcriptional regulator [Sphingomonas rubra]SFP60904.1 cAMP-binding domain of CRP or a regulatory subunit of cAMP-dependent protein kinases [Sphingomonas rubra]